MVDSRHIANLHKTVFSLSDHCFVFRHFSPTDIKYLAEDLFREGKKLAEVRRAIEDSSGVGISPQTLRTWKSRMGQARASAGGARLSPAGPGAVTEVLAGRQSAPAGPGSDGEDLWELIMAQRPPWSQKPRLARWMELVDAAYAFLVESDWG